MSALGLGCAKTPASAAHVETSRRNCAPWSRMMLRARCSIPCWRIVFSTFSQLYEFSHRLGHSRRIGTLPMLSVRFAPKADMHTLASKCPLRAKNGCEQPQQSNPLFDHLVGAGEQRGWHLEAERLGGIEIDHELELGQLDDRQVGRLLALGNPARLISCLTIGISKAGSITHQAAGRGEVAPFIHRRHRMACRQQYKLLAPGIKEWGCADKQRSGLLLNDR